MVSNNIRELQCPGCRQLGRFRLNDKGQIISSCPSCGWRPTHGHKIQRRYVVKEEEKDDGTKIRRLAE